MPFLYPGFGAVWHRQVMNDVWKHVFGWDWEKNKPVPGGGMYCGLEGAFDTTEEQTRKQLHGHGLGWMKRFKAIMAALQINDETVKRFKDAKLELIELHERTSSVNVINEDSVPGEKFEHEKNCTNIGDSKFRPVLKDEQHLRDMRHKTGKKERQGVFSYCDSCNKEYKIDDVLALYLKERLGYDTKNYWKYDKTTLEEQLFLNSYPIFAYDLERHKVIVDAVRNLHNWQHTPTCFKSRNKHECRMNFPTLPVKETFVKMETTNDTWHDWLGQQGICHKFDIVGQRGEYNIFSNQYQKAISLSKLGSNSNTQICANHHKAMYVTKYPTKSTQKEEEQEYSNVHSYVMRRLKDRKFESNDAEAMSRLIGASLAHSATNVVSPWLAKHLVREGSRFRFSHNFRYVANPSMEAELLGTTGTHRKMIFCKGKTFIDSGSLQHLDRPQELEHVTFVDYCRKYHVKMRHNLSKKDVSYEFSKDNGEYEGGKYQVVLKSEGIYFPVIKISNSPFS